MFDVYIPSLLFEPAVPVLYAWLVSIIEKPASVVESIYVGAPVLLFPKLSKADIPFDIVVLILFTSGAGEGARRELEEARA